MRDELAHAEREIIRLFRPLRGVADLDPLIERVSDARFVLIGEASHGTAEYYCWRADLSRRLIEQHGFSFVAVEGDWPDCFRVSCWAKGAADQDRDAHGIVSAFDRWPTWMWANDEAASFLDWLHGFNAHTGRAVGFYGLDVYSLWRSLDRLIRYVQQRRPDALPATMAALRCFEPYAEDPHRYAFSTRLAPDGCEDEVVQLLSDMRRPKPSLAAGAEADFDAEQNTEVIAGAERYYRTMVRADGESWNIRDSHMADTLDRLIQHHGPDAKAIVWAHNTHVGDARATDMAAAGMVNIGQLMRERHGDRVVLVGMGGFEGTVIASSHWDGPVQRVTVPQAREDSHEWLLGATGGSSLAVFPEDRTGPWLSGRRGHRAIGVVYDPARDRWGNWVPTVMGRRYDAFLYFTRTEALHPLPVHQRPSREEETYPWTT